MRTVIVPVKDLAGAKAVFCDLTLVKGLVGQHIKRLGLYKCDNCGFRARQYYWRCPGCQKWETYSPKRTEMPDGYA